MLLALFALLIFKIVSCIFSPGQPGLWSSYLYFLYNCDNRSILSCPAFIGWDRISTTICQGWPQTMTLLIAASQVARITGVSHHAGQVDVLSQHDWRSGMSKCVYMCSSMAIPSTCLVIDRSFKEGTSFSFLPQVLYVCAVKFLPPMSSLSFIALNCLWGYYCSERDPPR
jgi:hypothetical protein